jgi:hypothetical protein
LFLSRNYGNKGETEPGLFVHSNKHNLWLEITKISTKDGLFGKSWTDNKEDQKKLMVISVGRDFTKLKDKPYADMPLKTSGSISFPDKIQYIEKEKKYKLGFMTSCGVKTAITYLYINEKDLESEFDKLKNEYK